MAEFARDEEHQSSRIETQAYQASSELMETLHAEDSFCYKPWQFENHRICPLTLKTIYQEIEIWGKQQAMIRPGWKVEDGIVYVPNIFCKISGVPGNKKQLRKDINALRKNPNTLYYKNFPLCKKRKMKKVTKRYYSLLDTTGRIDRQKLLAAPFWRYKYTRTSLQEQIADRIIQFCSLPDFWKVRDLSPYMGTSVFAKVRNFFKFLGVRRRYKKEDMTRITIFEILNGISQPMLRILEKFDYPDNVPKVIVYNSKEGKFSFRDALILMFMSSMGADVIIYNPSGRNDIENFIKENYFDIHRLDQMES